MAPTLLDEQARERAADMTEAEDGDPHARTLARARLRDHRPQPTEEEGPAGVMRRALRLGETVMLEAYERASAVRLERDLDPAAAGPEFGVAVEPPGEDDPAFRYLNERAAGDVLAAIRSREAQPQR